MQQPLAPTRLSHLGGCGCGGPLIAGLAALLDLPDDLGRRVPHRPARDTGTVVIRGATVLPVDPAFSAHEAIAIRGNRILAVGTEDQVRAAAGPDAQVLDRPGATILPGFIEPHAHVLPTALLRTWHDVGPFRFDTVDAAVDHLASLAPTVERGQWLHGRQFDPSLQRGPDQLTTELLDRVSTESPSWSPTRRCTSRTPTPQRSPQRASTATPPTSTTRPTAGTPTAPPTGC